MKLVLATFIPSGLVATAMFQFVDRYHGAVVGSAVWCAVIVIMGVAAGALARDARIVPAKND